MKYEWWVYENLIISRARLHRGSCSRCKYGLGQHGKEGGIWNRWHGFSTKDEAVAFMLSLEKKDAKPCYWCCRNEEF